MWQIVLFRYVFHEIFWGVVLWGYRIVLRNCLGLDTGAQGLLIGRLVTMKAIYSKFLLVQLKGFGQIIAINIFDALLNFFLRSLYVIYDEWFMNMQVRFSAKGFPELCALDRKTSPAGFLYLSIYLTRSDLPGASSALRVLRSCLQRHSTATGRPRRSSRRRRRAISDPTRPRPRPWPPPLPFSSRGASSSSAISSLCMASP